MSDSKNKILIAYYSRKGQNYLDGRIVNLPIGNTEVAAQKIQAVTHGDLFQIETVVPYPKDYTETTEVAMAEKKANARPKLTNMVGNMDAYNVIYLGYPNWWGTFPMAVFTFLESYDFAGKTIIPFCTHEGSGLGNSERDIKKLCPAATVLPGLAIRGGAVSGADKMLESWINKRSTKNMTAKIIIPTLMALFLSINPTQAQTGKTNKILVVYFSHSGNTRVVANQIQELTGGDIFEIQPVAAYPTDYQTVVDQAKKEINANYRPALKAKVSDIEQYNVIFIGSPNWWSTIAPPVATFLTSYNFEGKTIVPFMTHEGGRMGHSEADIKKLCPKSTLLKALPIHGNYVRRADDDIANWLREIKLIKE